MNSSLSGGNTPNIASIYGDYVAGYMKAGATLVMDDYISNSDYGFGKSVDADGNIIDDASTAQSDINQSYLNGEKDQYSDGKFNSMPFSKSGETLAVNQSVFEKKELEKLEVILLIRMEMLHTSHLPLQHQRQNIQFLPTTKS